MSQPESPILTIYAAEEDAIALSLSEAMVSMRLSEKIVNQAREEMRNDPDMQGNGLINKFARFIAHAAEKLISTSIDYTIAEIANVSYTDGALVFTYTGKKHALSFEDITIGDHGDKTPVLRAFPPESARAFVEKFQEVKAHASA